MPKVRQQAPLLAFSHSFHKENFIYDVIHSLDFKKEVKVLPCMDVLLKSKGIEYGSPISGEVFWAVEDICSQFEQEWTDYPKIVESTPLDRYAYARASGLKMESYFDRIIPAFVRDCDCFFYAPSSENVVGNFVYNVDGIKRAYMQSNKLAVQVLAGSTEENVRTVKECIKLRFVGAIRG